MIKGTSLLRPTFIYLVVNTYISHWEVMSNDQTRSSGSLHSSQPVCLLALQWTWTDHGFNYFFIIKNTLRANMTGFPIL